MDLIGTPPFDFEWRRYELVWDSRHKRHSKGKVLESQMVHGIESHRYYITTSEAGTIEVMYFVFSGDGGLFCMFRPTLHIHKLFC